MSRLAAALPALLALAGCALVSKNEPLVPTYHAPPPPAGTSPAAARPAARPAPPLRLRVHPGPEHLDLRLVARTSDVTYELLEDRRWTERPAVYLRRALERGLFEEGAWRASDSPADPTLDVELTAFEELRAPRPAARVAFVLALSDEEGRGALRRTVEVTRPLQGRGAEAVARALGAALHEAVAEALRLVEEAAATTK